MMHTAVCADSAAYQIDYLHITFISYKNTLPLCVLHHMKTQGAILLNGLRLGTIRVCVIALKLYYVPSRHKNAMLSSAAVCFESFKNTDTSAESA